MSISPGALQTRQQGLSTQPPGDPPPGLPWSSVSASLGSSSSKEGHWPPLESVAWVGMGTLKIW